MGRALVVVRRGRQPGDLPLDLLDLRLCRLVHRPPERDPATSHAHGTSPGSTSTIDTWTLREYTDSDAEATLTRVPPRNPRDGCWRLLAGSGCRMGCRAWRPSGVAHERAAAHTQVATIDGRVAEFTDLDDDGYVDMLFVDPDLDRQAVATSMLAATIALTRHRGLLP
jgi:GNAT superfamily N-acetyltransferase